MTKSDTESVSTPGMLPHPTTWRERPEAQAIPWPDHEKLESALGQLRKFPPLVFAGEIRTLREQLAKAEQGEAFLLQGGDCAEDFSRLNAVNIRETLRVLLQMAVVLTYATGRPVIKVGRIAGQYAKPRSAMTEMVGGIEMPSFRGENVNSPDSNLAARTPDPARLVTGYHYAASTLNLLRAFTKGGFADLHRVHAFNKEFAQNSPFGESYERIASQIDAALAFVKACGIDTEHLLEFQQVDFFTSHEALVLGYEDALTRQDHITGEHYCCSGHLLWIGDRTRQLDGAHVEFFKHVKNPVGMKVGPSISPDELLKLMEALNPQNERGRLTLICRFGAQKAVRMLPRLIRAVKRAGLNALWSCDPMHGNTFKSTSGYKTRHFHHILAELRTFFAVHEAEGTIPGGVHFELTGDSVTECLGGEEEIEDAHLAERYLTSCDPRLNARQSLELAFLMADALRKH